MTDDQFLKLHELITFGKNYIPTTAEAEEFMQRLPQGSFIENEYCFVPSNENAINLAQNSALGEVIYLQEVSARDLNFHKAYMSFLSFVWGFMPNKFKSVIAKNVFYKFLKHLKKSYSVVYSFKDGEKRDEITETLKLYKKELRLTYKAINKIAELFGKIELVEYESISFGRMTEARFHEYIKEQLPYLYSNVIGAFFEGERLDDIIFTIEKEYKSFLKKV